MIRTGQHLILSLWAETGFEAEVGPVRRGEGIVPVTIAHNVRTDDEVDAVLELARAAGADPVQPGRQRDWGGYSGYFADPDGFRVGDRHQPRPDRRDRAARLTRALRRGCRPRPVPRTYPDRDVQGTCRPLQPAGLPGPAGARRRSRTGRTGAPARRAARSGAPGGRHRAARPGGRRAGDPDASGRPSCPRGTAGLLRPAGRRHAGSSPTTGCWSPTTAPPGPVRSASWGRHRPDAIVPRLLRAAAPFARSGRPVQPVFELIVTVADADPTRTATTATTSRAPGPALHRAPPTGTTCCVVLDLQPGRADFLDVAKSWAWALRDPWVGLALDPEWRMGPHGVPGHAGSARSAPAEVNRVSAWLAT